MNAVYHPRVQQDVSQALRYYDQISVRLGDDFWKELTTRIGQAAANPLRYRIYSEPLRRADLNRFPYHFLFRTVSSGIRVIVVRHNKRHPDYGLARR